MIHLSATYDRKLLMSEYHVAVADPGELRGPCPLAL